MFQPETKGQLVIITRPRSVLLSAPLLLLAVSACGSPETGTGQTLTGTVGTINYIIPGDGTVECRPDNPDLRPDVDSYQVALASNPDQTVAFTQQDLQDRDWSIQLSFD